MRRVVHVSEELTVGIIPMSLANYNQYQQLIESDIIMVQDEQINTYPHERQPRLSKGFLQRLKDFVFA